MSVSLIASSPKIKYQHISIQLPWQGSKNLEHAPNCVTERTSQDQLTFLKLHELKKYYTDIATKIYDISDLSLGSRESY